MKTLKLLQRNLLYILLACVPFVSCEKNNTKEKSWIDKLYEQKKNAPEWARYYVWDGDNDTVIFYADFKDLQYLAVGPHGVYGLTCGTVNQEFFWNMINFPPPVTKEEAEAIRRVKYAR